VNCAGRTEVIRWRRRSVMALLLTGGLYLLPATFLAAPANASNAGDLDPTFGNGGVASTPLPATSDAHSVVVQPDGKIVVAGCTDTCDDNLAAYAHTFVVARFLPDGQLDSTFGSGGVVQTGFGAHGQAHSVALQADGKIVVAGCKGCAWSGPSDFALAR